MIQRSVTSVLVIVAASCLSSLRAEEPVLARRLSATDRISATPLSLSQSPGTQPVAIAKVYDLYAAEPPQLRYALEVRYLPYGDQAGSDWFVFTTAASQEDLQENIVWVLLHLIADYRVTTYYPDPDWELVATYDSQLQAQLDAISLQSLGLLTQVSPRFRIPLQVTHVHSLQLGR